MSPSGVHAADHTGAAGSGSPSVPRVPLGGTTTVLISSCVRASSTVVPSAQVSATMLPSGLTATDAPAAARARVSPTGTSSTTSPVSGSMNAAVTDSVPGPGPSPASPMLVPGRVGTTSSPSGPTTAGRFAIHRPSSPG